MINLLRRKNFALLIAICTKDWSWGYCSTPSHTVDCYSLGPLVAVFRRKDKGNYGYPIEE